MSLYNVNEHIKKLERVRTAADAYANNFAARLVDRLRDELVTALEDLKSWEIEVGVYLGEI